MKELNLDERARTIKKLIEANEQLRGDLAREADRYVLLENKYKDVLLTQQQLAKENAKNEELVVGMTTGGNMNRDTGFLSDQQEY
jgi:hypothetical protein